MSGSELGEYPPGKEDPKAKRKLEDEVAKSGLHAQRDRGKIGRVDRTRKDGPKEKK